MYIEAKEFYPTPKKLLEKITVGVKWREIKSVLEPSAGKGDVAEFVQEQMKRYYTESDIDCIEMEPDLCHILAGKGFRIVADDFLKFHTFKKYDLIIMNPPFSNGDEHLLKALEMQQNGGSILCILNAETIRNPYTNRRKDLCRKLDELNAQIEYFEDEFVSAENPCGVEIAVIKVFIPQKIIKSKIYEELRKKSYQEMPQQEQSLVSKDFIRNAIAHYNLEVEAGIHLIQEYKAMSPYLLNKLKDKTYSRPILEMKLGNNQDLSTNDYVKRVRYKYWSALFNDHRFTGNMTSNLLQSYQEQVDELQNYDFSYWNIKTVQERMSKQLVDGIEDCIIRLFDELSYQYSYESELSKNIHYYNGWKTNKCWIINKKVILPWMNAFSQWDGSFQPNYEVKKKLSDIEKALNYLDGGLTDARDLDECLRAAVKSGQTKKIELKYFYVTFYKKGTCHIEFKNEELLKKLNIFGGQQKRWLPPAYGRKKYNEMTTEEKEVVDSFEGETTYNEVMCNTEYYIYNPQKLPMLEVS